MTTKVKTKLKSNKKNLQVRETSPVYTAELTENISATVIDYFNKVKFNGSWIFEGCTTKDTKYITHGYHRYPAKFIPQLAARLIRELSKTGDIVCDPFMGSGTTLVEAKVLGRPSIGVDINPVAHLISRVKITPIEPNLLHSYFSNLLLKISSLNDSRQRLSISIEEEKLTSIVPKHPRIDYWFKPETKEKLSAIYSEIRGVQNKEVQNFFLCGFSNILKNCSIWLMKSNKPTRDFGKIIPDPYKVFISHIKMMVKKNTDFWNLLQHNKTFSCPTKSIQGDTRNVPADNNSVTLVVTSPPYVTSYEYADLHQLSALWFEHTSGLPEFRKSFIGSAYNDTDEVIIDSVIGEDTIQALEQNKTGKAKEVAIYFSEMRQSFIEMHRYLKREGKACIVIGDTAFKKVSVPNAEVFVEQMINIGFKIFGIIKRTIPSKILPQTRDPLTGKFTPASNNNKILAYPYEYIIIMEKI